MKYDGKHCPHCQSETIQKYDLEVDGFDSAYRDCHCVDCNKEWTETFELTGCEEMP